MNETVREFLEAQRNLYLKVNNDQSSDMFKILNYKLENGKDIKLSKIEDIIGKELADHYRQFVGDIFLTHQCYKNSIHFGMMLNAYDFEVEYVEGIMLTGNFGFPIEHCWNKVNGQYVDITQEFVLDNDVTEIPIVAYTELPIWEAIDFSLKLGLATELTLYKATGRL